MFAVSDWRQSAEAGHRTSVVRKGKKTINFIALPAFCIITKAEEVHTLTAWYYKKKQIFSLNLFFQDEEIQNCSKGFQRTVDSLQVLFGIMIILPNI